MAAPKPLIAGGRPRAASKPLTAGNRLRIAAEQLLDLADRFDTPQASLLALQRLQDDTEAVAGDVRAVVRGRGFR